MKPAKPFVPQTNPGTCGGSHPGPVFWRFYFAWIALAAGLLLGLLTGCTVETVTTRETSAKGYVVETTRTTKKADPAAWALAGDVVAAYSPPRARRIREEKSGPITAAEIANRWKP